MSEEPVRLSKVMAERGLCSRREADVYIERGWVRVDGQVVDQLGTRILRDQQIELDSRAKRQQSDLATILMHKPIGFVSAQPEHGYEPAIVLITPDRQDPDFPGPRLHPEHMRGLAVAGRLDIDSKGLLVFTQDGRIARQLIGEDSEMEKEYLVRVEGLLAPGGLERLRHGLIMDGKALEPAQVEWLNDGQLRFVLREGRKRQIRRMCEAVGLKVTGLKRVRIGRVRLGKLREGMWRFLRPGEEF